MRKMLIRASLLLCIALPAFAQSDVAALKAKYPDADLAARELGMGVYQYALLTPTQIGHVGVGAGGMHLEEDCMYCGKKIVFLGDVDSYVTAGDKSTGYRSRIVNVATLDYDPTRKTNPPLSALGVVALNEVGIVKSDTAKSGWVNWVARLQLSDEGRSRNIFLSDINFWVNRGGDNWISFSVGKAREFNSDGSLGAEVPLSVSLDHKGPNGSVTIRVADKYSFHPSIKNDTTLVFVAD